MAGLMAYLHAQHYAPTYAPLSPLKRLVRWLRGGPYADVLFA